MRIGRKKPNPVTGVYEGKGASSPEEMKKKVDKAGKKAKGRGVYLEKEDEKEETKQEVETAEGGMSESYLETDMKKRQANNEKARKDMEKMGTKMKNPHFGDGPTGSMKSEAYGDMAQRGVEKLNNTKKAKLQAKIMEQENRMAMYSRALGVMGAQYSGKPSVQEASKPDYLDFDKDGDKEEDMKKALKEKGKKAHDKAHDKEEKSEKKESVELTKEMVVSYLVAEGYASNEVSAEILHQHMSDEFLEELEGRLTEALLNEEYTIAE